MFFVYVHICFSIYALLVLDNKVPETFFKFPANLDVCNLLTRI